MTISVGDKLPTADLMRIGDAGPEMVDLGAKLAGRKVVIFGLPGAYTGTCSNAHVPSFMRTKADLEAKGVDEIICVAVNDAFVMKAWGDSTGANDAGLSMLGDPSSAFTKAIGMDFDVPPVGFFGRSKRYAMLVDDGVVKVLHQEENVGTCDTSSGEAMLAAM